MAKGGIESLYNRVGKELHSKKTLDNVPVRWRSERSHPETQLAYITDQEAALLKKLDIHNSGVRYKHHIGPHGIPSYNGAGSGDSAGGGNDSGGNDSAGGSPAGDGGGAMGGGDVGGNAGGSPAGDGGGTTGGSTGNDAGTTGGSPAGDATGGFGGGVGTGTGSPGGTTGGSPAGDGPGVMGGGNVTGSGSSLADAAATSPDMDSYGTPDPTGLATGFTGPGLGTTNMADAIGNIGKGSIGAYSGNASPSSAKSTGDAPAAQAAPSAAPAATSAPNAFAGMTGAQLSAQMDAMAQTSNVSVGPVGGLVGAAAPSSVGPAATSSAGVVSGSSVASAAAGTAPSTGPAQSAGPVADASSATPSQATSTPGIDSGYSVEGGIGDLVQNTVLPYPNTDTGIASLAPPPAEPPPTTGVNVLSPTVPTAFNISDFLSKPSQPVKVVYPYTYSDYLPVQGYRA